MKLSYRGTNYNYEPPALDVGEGIAMGKYRGQDYPVMRYPRHIPIPQAPLDLKYRGVAYSTHQTDEAVTTTTAPSFQPVSVPQAVTHNLADIHRTHLLDRLAHRIQVARERGDQNLIQQLELEMRELVF